MYWGSQAGGWGAAAKYNHSPRETARASKHAKARQACCRAASATAAASVHYLQFERFQDQCQDAHRSNDCTAGHQPHHVCVPLVVVQQQCTQHSVACTTQDGEPPPVPMQEVPAGPSAGTKAGLQRRNQQLRQQQEQQSMSAATKERIHRHRTQCGNGHIWGGNIL